MTGSARSQLGGAGERHDHVGLGPAIIVEVGERGTLKHFLAIAAHDPDLARAAGAQRRELPVEQRPPVELHQAFGPDIAQGAHAAAAARGENEGAHQAALNTLRNSAMSSAANGEFLSGCHMMPVIGREACHIALITPSGATAHTSSGGRESLAPKL